HVAVQEKADAAEHLLLFDVLAPGQPLPDALGQGFTEGHPEILARVIHQRGSLISMPYLGATASSFSISSFVGGRAVVEPSGSGTPPSKNIFSRPAGATEISILAGLLLSFLKECGVPTGMLANIPVPATRRFSPIVNVISPSRT